MPRAYVAPRYTCGSPAMVDEKTAMTVAREEKTAFEGYQEGWYGDEGKATTDRLGLDWIVYTIEEKGRNLIFVDVLTGVTLTKPVPKQGQNYHFIPIYSNVLSNYMSVSAKLHSAKIRTQEWTQTTANHTQNTLLCVPVEDFATARQLIEWMGLNPMADLHNERRVA